MEPDIKPTKPSRETQARRLAHALGVSIMDELIAARQLRDYSSFLPLSVPKDVFDRNLAIKRRRFQVATKTRKAAHKSLCVHLGFHPEPPGPPGAPGRAEPPGPPVTA